MRSTFVHGYISHQQTSILMSQMKEQHETVGVVCVCVSAVFAHVPGHVYLCICVSYTCFCVCIYREHSLSMTTGYNWEQGAVASSHLLVFQISQSLICSSPRVTK